MFALNQADSLDFKEYIGLSWERYRCAKRFLRNRSIDVLASTRQITAETNERKITSTFDFTHIQSHDSAAATKPCLVISDLKQYLQECWESSLISSSLNHDERFKNEIWVGIAGDKGGGSTKLTAVFMNFEKPQSVHNVHILGNLYFLNIMFSNVQSKVSNN